MEPHPLTGSLRCFDRTPAPLTRIASRVVLRLESIGYDLDEIDCYQPVQSPNQRILTVSDRLFIGLAYEVATGDVTVQTWHAGEQPGVALKRRTIRWRERNGGHESP
jgi:hypothetical protein